MSAPSRRYNTQGSVRGLSLGVVIAVVVALALTLAFAGMIWLSSTEDGVLQEGETSFSAVSSESAESEPPPSLGHYTITLDVSAWPGAVLDDTSVEVDLGTQADLLPFATLDGMRFTGWYTAPGDDDSAVRIDNNSLGLLTPDTDQTLYARFEERPTSLDYESNGLPILMYHYFYDPDLGESGADGNWMNIHLFGEHLAYLHENNYYYPTWEEVAAYIRGEILLPEPSIVLCSDDGDESFFRLAAPLVLSYEAKMTSFIVLADLDPSRLQEYDPEHILIQSHSYDMHRSGVDGDSRILTSSYEEVYDDAMKGMEILGNTLAYCYPFGDTTEIAKQALSDAGVGVALIIGNDRAYPLCDPMEVPRLRISDGVGTDYLASSAY